MKNCNMKFTEKQAKYQHYRQVKVINMNISQVKKCFPLIKVQFKYKLTIEQVNFEYSSLGKAFEKQIKTIKEQEKNKQKLQKF